MRKIEQTKSAYTSPKLGVTQVEGEGPITASATPVVANPSWDTSDDTWANYDGDIWFPH